MKKAFTLVVLIATSTMAFAQGTVGIINNTAGLVKQWTSASDPTLIQVPVGGAQLELLVAPAGTSLTPLGALTPGGFYANFSTLESFLAANPGWETINTASGLPSVGISPVAGRFNGGNVSLPGINGGATAEYFIMGWTGTATTFDAAIQTPGTWFGSSPLLTTLTGISSPTLPGTPVPLSATFTGLTLAPTPEPSTFALAGLGAALLLLVRRCR